MDLSTRPEWVTTDDDITVRIMWDVEWYWPADFQGWHLERGTCAEVAGAGSLLHPDPDEATVGQRWPLAWIDDGGRYRPVRIDGIADDEVPAAVELLVDTARCIRAYRSARAARVRGTLGAVRQAAQALADAWVGGEPGGERWFRIQRARDARDARLRTAVAEWLAPAADLAEAAGITESELQEITRDVVPASARAPLYLDIDGFARRANVTSATLRTYKARGRLPEPDITLGGSPGWLVSTVEDWVASRPGQGTRTDLG